MCGITGVLAFTEKGKDAHACTEKAMDSLYDRGPDRNGQYRKDEVSLGHTRLCVIDTSEEADQPFIDASGRYTIIFNGEIYNFMTLKAALRARGYEFRSHSDTEVLLYQFIEHGEEGLQELDGFFAFAIYDQEQHSLFLARDRMGIKPLLFYYDEDKLVFGSQLDTLMAYDIPRKVDPDSLHLYLQLNYVPAPYTMLEGVQKLMPGECLKVENKQVRQEAYYELPQPSAIKRETSWQETSDALRQALEKSVEQRMVADVPLGSFLSGGVDSSIVSAIAARHTDHLKTFSIGYKDAPYFDETHYAREVARKIGSDHHVFYLTEEDLFQDVDQVLNALDEPFADSSAIAVHILSKKTRGEVTVALSGDGADELFGGYNKHRAEYNALHKKITNLVLKGTGKVWDFIPASRNSNMGNRIRQMRKYSEGVRLSPEERYWRWASILKEGQATRLISLPFSKNGYRSRKKKLLTPFEKESGIDAVLMNDLSLVLPNDMLTKVDRMSMANSLEVRTPFLDHELVELAISMPVDYKLDGKMGKQILQETFRDDLPEELFGRPKQGFEVPLLKWMKNRMGARIEQDLAPSFLKEQGLFNAAEVNKVLKRLHSGDPGDSAATVWALLVFQHWWKRYIATS